MKNDELKNVPAADAGLDAALAQMAEEVPPMPADFHDRWMNAVRAEAEKAQGEPEKEKTRNRAVSIVRWTRILSVAAAFVFLIGGTLLYRNARKTLSDPYTAEPAAVSAEEAETAGEEAPEVMDSYLQADAGYAEEADYAMDAAVPVVNAFSASSKEASTAMGATVESAEEADYAADYDMVYEAAEEERAAMPEQTEEPAETPESTAEPTAEPTEEPKAEAGFLTAAGSFFTDMGDFLLAALPYLLVLAVPAAAALVISRKKAGK